MMHFHEDPESRIKPKFLAYHYSNDCSSYNLCSGNVCFDVGYSIIFYNLVHRLEAELKNLKSLILGAATSSAKPK